MNFLASGSFQLLTHQLSWVRELGRLLLVPKYSEIRFEGLESIIDIYKIELTYHDTLYQILGYYSVGGLYNLHLYFPSSKSIFFLDLDDLLTAILNETGTIIN